MEQNKVEPANKNVEYYYMEVLRPGHEKRQLNTSVYPTQNDLAQSHYLRNHF